VSWSKSLTRTSKPEPYDSVLFCGICGVEILVTRRQQAELVATWSQADLIAWWESQEMKTVAHLATYHRLRYWLWRRLGSHRFRWLVGGLR